MISSILEKYDKQFEYTGIMMNIIIALQFLMLWIDPKPDQAAQIMNLAILIAAEFIMLHTGIFMAVFPKKYTLFIFFPFYGLFAYFFNTLVTNNLIIMVYLITILNRMRFAFSNPSPELKKRTKVMAVSAGFTYFILIFIIGFGSPYIPSLGLNDQFLDQSGYHLIRTQGGLFLEKPYTAICLGFSYYSITAIIEAILLVSKKFKPISAQLT
ncbi:hypothetical protein SAMN04487906_0304 [Zhouia amylolytica]|uniref:Uncharacterized protein n=1 Tax=Zhouia amylolytica TaxID=376730 RepID=A0A1I6PI03_9FLAO|nr:hypothetical protein [Zhouia amylolytica]SFS39708.1 hypothetical protein SAMN04487906_0304 [Zhouia amylolytica]